jgi:hypothetical protein
MSIAKQPQTTKRDFLKYKPRLKEYLTLKGIEIDGGLCHCIDKNHEDKNPSCQIGKETFHCFSCGITGDIYDAVMLLENITDKLKQYDFIEKLFAGGKQ